MFAVCSRRPDICKLNYSVDRPVVGLIYFQSGRPSLPQVEEQPIWQAACAYNAEAYAVKLVLGIASPPARRTQTAHLRLFRFLKPQTG